VGFVEVDRLRGFDRVAVGAIVSETVRLRPHEERRGKFDDHAEGSVSGPKGGKERDVGAAGIEVSGEGIASEWFVDRKGGKGGVGSVGGIVAEGIGQEQKASV
jgi:hypothetical protein